MNFEEVIKHLSDTYEKVCECEICLNASKVLQQYEFLSLKKWWDYGP